MLSLNPSENGFGGMVWRSCFISRYQMACRHLAWPPATKVKGRPHISFSCRPLLCLHRLPEQPGDRLKPGQMVTSFPASLLQVRGCRRHKQAVPLAWRSGRGHAPSSWGAHKRVQTEAILVPGIGKRRADLTDR